MILATIRPRTARRCPLLWCLPQTVLSVTVCIFAACVPSEVLAAYSFAKIVDTTTVAPGSASPFTSFASVAYDGQNIAFIGKSGASSVPGIYQWNGSQLGKIVTVGDAIPSSALTFTNFANLALDGGFVAFQGVSGTLEGVYTNLGGSMQRVADTTTVMPGSTAIFKNLYDTATPSFDVALDGSTVYFSGFGSNGAVFDEGVYRKSGAVLSAVANRSTIFPGETTPFTFFSGELDADGGHVLMEPDGLYTTHGVAAGSFRKVFDRDSTLPGLTPPLSVFSPNSFSLDAGTTAFIASHGTTFDSYLYIQQPNGVSRKIVDETQTNPVTNNVFSVIGHSYSLSNGRVLFTGWSTSGSESVDAIYLSNDTAYDPIISDLATLDAKNLTGLNVYKDSLVDRNFVFESAFSDGSRGLYLATFAPDLPTQTIAVTPTFDVQLRPGNQYPIGDGQQTLVIDGGSGTSFPVLQVLAEFPLGSIPDGAHITAANLRLDALSTANMTINARGYGADGLASLSDEFVSTTLIGSKAGSITTAGDITIPLDAAFIEALLNGHTHFGVRLESATTGPFVNIAAIEHLTGFEPTLNLTFALADPASLGDFNNDGLVNAADYVVWRKKGGTQAEYNTWRTHFGETTGAGVGASDDLPSQSAVPEPTTTALLLFAAAGWCVRHGRDVTKSSVSF